MKYLNKEDYKRQLAKARQHSKQKKMQMDIKDEANSWKDKKPKLETSKKLAIYLFLLMNAVIIYCLVAMWHFSDLSYLGVLITDIAAQILVYAIYCLKAYKAKKSSEDLKFEREKLQGLGEVLDVGSDEKEPTLINGNMSEPNYKD